MVLSNPIGFGPADFLELALALFIVLLALASRPFIEPYGERLAQRTRLCMLLLAALPVMLRLVLLPHHPVPTPDIYDEFGHLLVADTLLHFRLANPPHPMSRFFETFFVLQQPSYSAIYPVGQGLVLAIGRLISGVAWTGVVLSTGAFCALCYWMLRGWTTPGWSLLGGGLAVIEFGPLNLWMNNYWGGAVPAAAGCLVFGALPRLRHDTGLRNAALLGIGLVLHLLTRPYESIFLLLSVVLYVTVDFRLVDRNRIVVVVLVVLPAIGITLLQNKRTTGSFPVPPYLLSQRQYGVPAGLTFQKDPVPQRTLTPQQAMEYKSQLGFRSGPETLHSYFLRIEYRVRFYRFFFVPPLYLALLAFLTTLRRRRYIWVAATLVLFALGVNFFPAWQHHYIAAVVCLFILVSVTGLERIGRWNSEAAWVLVCLCVAHFVFWYGMHVFDATEVSRSLRPYETWDYINHGNPERRILVNEQLARLPGKLLVFVRYSPQHIFQDEWVYNAADIDHTRIVWARDLGAEDDQNLIRYYADRTVLLLEPDARPPRLTPYAR